MIQTLTPRKDSTMFQRVTFGLAAIAAGAVLIGTTFAFDPSEEATKHIAKLKVQAGDWPSWGGTPYRNNTPAVKNIPESWDLDSGENVLWTAELGSQTYGNPVIANGKVYVGTNNGFGYIKRFPTNVDLGALLCFDEKTGDFLWQASSPKLPTGRVHDWPQQGVCSTVYCEDSRVWYVTSRGEVTCLDAEGFRDNENDGSFKAEPSEDKYEADVIWKLDMMGALGVSQHNMCSCSVTAMGDYLFVDTGNGVDESHINIPAPNAPSHLCLDKNTGKLLWSDNSPGTNVLHGQWSSPCYFVADSQPQIVFGSGDGWLYSFDPAGDGKGGPKLLWKFDGNPKKSIYLLGGRATRNHFIGTPVFYDGHLYAAVGEDPEHGEGVGHLYCIDPTKRGDISLELAVDAKGKELPHRRLQAVDEKKMEEAIPNPNAAVVWHYDSVDRNGNKKADFEEVMHRTIGSVAIKDDLLYIADFSGLVHCLDAKQTSEPGKPVVHWTHDMFAASWGSPLIADGKVFIGDEDGDITVFELSKELNIIGEINMVNSIYSTPVAANDTLFISNKSTLFAIKSGAKLEGGFKPTPRTDGGAD
jgi:hypothetical protein